VRNSRLATLYERCINSLLVIYLIFIYFNLRVFEEGVNLRSSKVSVRIKTYRTVILPVVLCGCVTWCVALKEELG
jgi:hypothetical protein